MAVGQLGTLDILRENWSSSAENFVHCVRTFLRVNAPHDARRSVDNFLVLLDRAPDPVRPSLKQTWLDAGLPPVWEEGVSVDDVPASSSETE